MTEEFDKACDDFLGVRELRSRTHPTGERHAPVGGIAYKRSSICKSVQGNARCYTLGPSAESPTSIVAPVASAKFDKNDEVDPMAHCRSRLLQVRVHSVHFLSHASHLLHMQAAGDIARAAFDDGPTAVCERTKEMASLINLPIIGVADNYAYGTAQGNVAAAKRP